MTTKQKGNTKKNTKTSRPSANKKTPKTPVEPPSSPPVAEKKVRTPSLLRGMRDILPKEEQVWQKLYDTGLRIATAYGFGQIGTPLLEETSLFFRSIGKGTDIVEKEMYVFDDRDGTKVSLRPEATASMVRAYIGHGLFNSPQPVKMWQFGPMFRHDRPQAGRYRQFHQFDCETIGDRDPVIDAELIAVAYNFLGDLGIETRVEVNSIGNSADRERYVAELLGYLRTKRSYLCEDCKKRMARNPLRVLDCKEEGCQGALESAPQIIDWLSEESKNYFMKVLEYLDELGIPYLLRSTLVRGLDYYSDTVFELYAEKVAVISEDGEEATEPKNAQANQKRQSALGGGGRYDGLVEQLGGNPTPACGFAIGLERVAALLRDKSGDGQTPLRRQKIFLAQLGEQARRRALSFIEDWRKHGIIVAHQLGRPSLKAQLELANKIGATHTVIIGQKEVQEGTVIIRNMESGIQETVDQKKIRTELEKILREE